MVRLRVGYVLRPLIGALALVLMLARTAHAEATWLDTQPQPWNVPGAAVSAAPPIPGIAPPGCGTQERSAASDEESQLAAAGWHLENYWQAQRAGNTFLVLATAYYDGMCRPWQFNAFVFVDGRFAGTLSPVAMNSRFDGVLNLAPKLTSQATIEAAFTRYAESDPLCCPSRPQTLVSYRIEGTAGSSTVVPVRIFASAPTLPRTGGVRGAAGALSAVLSAMGGGAGIALRRRRTSSAAR